MLEADLPGRSSCAEAVGGRAQGPGMSPGTKDAVNSPQLR